MTTPLSRLLAVLSFITAASGCVRPRPAAMPQATVPEARLVATLRGAFNTPESVRYDPDQDVYFVSSIGGVPGIADGDGAIARVSAEHPDRVEADFIRGGRVGVTLDAPAGLALSGDTLWTADITRLRAFDRRTGRPLATLDLAPLGAAFLNDLAVGPDGALYATDSGYHWAPDASVEHVGPDRIYRIAGGVARVEAEMPAGSVPNGITWDGARGRWLLAPSESPALFTWLPGETPALFADVPGDYDGVEVLGDGRVLVSNWADSTVVAFRRDGASRRIASGLAGPADIGVDTRRRLLLVPVMLADEVRLYALPDEP